MLLYDRICRQAAQTRRSPQDEACYAALRAAQVLDISAVVPLFQDWQRDRLLPIPKRPPFDTVWGEWAYSEENPEHTEHWQWTIGCLLERLTREDVLTLASVMLPPERNDWGAVLGHGPVRDDFWGCDEFYMGQSFSYMTQCSGRYSQMLKRPMWVLGYVVFGMRQGSTEVRTTRVMPPRSMLERGQTGQPPLKPHELGFVSRFGLMSDLTIYPTRYDQFNVPWPLLMAFALLHCRNIVQETVTPAPKLARKHTRHGHPPLTTYKVLRVAVPHEHHAQAGLAGAPAGPGGVRLHLCRGHFKLLTHARFKTPGWHWWPAHWRGDPVLGRVDQRYELTTAGGHDR